MLLKKENENSAEDLSVDEILGQIKEKILCNNVHDMPSDDDSVLDLVDLIGDKTVNNSTNINNKLKISNNYIDNDFDHVLNLIKNNSDKLTPANNDLSDDIKTSNIKEEKKEQLKKESEVKSTNTNMYDDTLKNIVLDAVTPILNDWIEKNLSKIIKENDSLLRGIVFNSLTPILDTWLERNLPKIVSKSVEEKLEKIVKRI